MRPSAVVDGSSLLRNDVQFVAREKNCRSGTDDVGSAPLVLLTAGAAAAPDEDTLRLLRLVATVGDSGSGSRDTVGCSDGSGRQVGGFTAARHTLPPTLYL